MSEEREAGRVDMARVAPMAEKLSALIRENDLFKSEAKEDVMAALAASMIAVQTTAGLPHESLHQLIDFMDEKVTVVPVPNRAAMEKIQAAIDSGDSEAAVRMLSEYARRGVPEMTKDDIEKAVKAADEEFSKILTKMFEEGGDLGTDANS